LIASGRAKWDPEYQRHMGLPARLSKKMHTKLADLSKEIYRLLGMSGYARLDYRVTEAGDEPLIALDIAMAFEETGAHLTP
jgi:D-alanine-D-alanine ligase